MQSKAAWKQVRGRDPFPMGSLEETRSTERDAVE